MTIIKNHAKKLLAGLFALTIAFVMTGCSTNPLLTAYEDALAEANITLAEAKDLVAIPNQTSITANVVLPTKVVREEWEATVSWASSNPAVISTTGVVARQTANTDVTLTATINYVYNYGGEDTPSASIKVLDTKVFNLTVIAAPVVPTPTTVAAALASPNASSPDSDRVLLEGVVAGVNIDDGFFIKDATGVLYVYSSSTVAVGDIVRVNAHKVLAFDQPQICDKTASSTTKTTNVTIVSHNNPIDFYPMYTNVTVDQFSKLLPGTQGAYGRMIRLYGKITSVVGETRTDYYINDPYTGAQLQIYYKSSSFTTMANYVNEYVNVILNIKGYYNANTVPWAMTYSSFLNSIEIAEGPTDTQYVSNALVHAEEAISSLVVSGQTLDLPVSYNGVTYSYALPAGELNAAIVAGDLETEEVEAEVNLTITGTKGNISFSFVKTIGISLDTVTVAEFNALAVDEAAFLSGFVVGAGGVNGNDYYWLQDAAGDFIKVEDSLGTSVVGDEVIIQAAKKTSTTAGVYADNSLLMKLVSQNNTFADSNAVAYTFTELTAKNADLSAVGTYVKFTSYVKFAYLSSTTAYWFFDTAEAATSNILSYQYSSQLGAALFALEGRQVEVYAFVTSLSAAVSGNIRLAVQKITAVTPVVPTSVSINALEYIGVGESYALQATFNAGITPRAIPGDLNWELTGVGDGERASINATTGVLTATATGSVTVRATSVADNTKSAEITVNIGPAPFAVETFESAQNTGSSYLTAAADYTMLGMTWSATQVASMAIADANDLYSMNAGSIRDLRFRGANTPGATLDTKNYITGGVSTMVFDAKIYNSTHSAAILSVYKWEEGVDSDWVLVRTISGMSLNFKTYAFNINASGNVKIRISSGPYSSGKTANIDNIKLYRPVA